MKNSTILLLAVTALLSACGDSKPCDDKCHSQRWADNIYNYQQRAHRANEELKKQIQDAAAAGFGVASGVVATDYSEICINHIAYLQFSTGVTVEYDADGRIKTCL